MDHSKEAAVRARAYQLWVESGYADGYQDQHWRQAEREFDERARGEADGAVAVTSGAPVPSRADGQASRHSDGMSLHPSVLDPGPDRAAR